MNRATAIGVGIMSAASIAAIGYLYRRSNRILRAVHDLIPCDYGTQNWEWMMGGLVKPGVFRYYSDGWGTTCGVVAAAVFEHAGVNEALINRGNRFVIGAHISRIYSGAKKLGYLHEDTDLQPGDMYYVRRDSGVEHVGFIVEKNGADTITADGGQKDNQGRQCARLCKRRFEGDVMIRNGDKAKLRWYVRIK